MKNRGVRLCLALFGAGLFFSTTAWSQIRGAANERTIEVFIDADNDAATGCSHTLLNGAMADGVELVLVLTVETGQMAQVTGAVVERCSDPNVSLSIQNWPVGSNNGTSASDVVEAFVPLILMGITAESRLVVQASEQRGNPQLPFDIIDAFNFQLPAPIPTLSEWMLLVYTVLFLALAVWIMRKRRRLGPGGTVMVTMLVAIVFFAFVGNFPPDGQVDDWNPTDFNVPDPAGDASGSNSVDLLAAFVGQTQDNLCLRFDIVELEAQPPTADDQMVSTDEDMAVVITLTGSDPDNDPLTFSIDTPPGNGSLGPITQMPPSSAQVTYTPNLDYSGPDSFVFQVDDGFGGLDLGTVSITVNPENDCPSAEDDAVGTDEDSALNGDVLAANGGLADSDPENDPLTVTEVNGVPANVGMQIALGSGALLTVNADGSFSYDPNGQFESLGTGDTDMDSFTYTIDDGSMTCAETATVTVTIDGVNDCPTAEDDAVAVGKDNLLNGDVLAANGGLADSDPENDTLTVTAVNGSGANVGVQFALASGALLTVNSDGTFVYDPNGQFEPLGQGDTDTDSFTYTIDDGSGTCAETATVTITVNGINDCPTAVDDAVATDEDTVLNGDVLAANPTTPDSDPETDPLTVTAVNGVPANVGMQFALGSGALLTVNANGSFSYDPNGQFESLDDGDTGMDSFTYTIDDGSGTCAETATVTITIDGVNDCPTAVDDAIATDEDTVLNGDVLAANPTTPDSDPETDPLTVTAVNGMAGNVGVQFALGSGALLTVNANGSFSYDPNGQFETLDDGDTDMDSFTYTIDDGSGTCAETATVTITIDGVNDCPTAVNDAVATDEDMVLNGDVLAANPTTPDSDPETDPLTVTAVNGSVANVGVQIALASGALLTVNANGSFSYDPNGAFDGLTSGESDTDSFTYTIDDGSGTCAETATVTITIDGVNDIPMAVADADYQTHCNVTLEAGGLSSGVDALPSTFGSVLANDSDPDGPGPLIVTALVGSGDVTPPFTGATTLGGTVTIDSDGTFHYTPPAGVRGMNDSFQYTVSDQATVPGTANGTATIALSTTCHWFIKDDDGGSADGTTLNPFTTIAQFNASGQQIGDTIFIYEGTTTLHPVPPTPLDGQFNLLDQQTLTGQGVNLDVTHPEDASTVTLVSAATHPVVINTTGDIVILADDNTVQGLNLLPVASAAIVGGGAIPMKHRAGGTTLLTNLIINPALASDGLQINGQIDDFTFQNSTIAGLPGATGTGFIFANGAITSFAATNITIDGVGTGIDMFSNAGTHNFDQIVIGGVNPPNTGWLISNSGTVNVTQVGGNSSIASNGGPALAIDPTAVGMSFTSITSANSSSEGVDLNSVTGSLTVGTTTVTDPVGTGIVVANSFGGGGTADFGNTGVTLAGDAGGAPGDGINLSTNAGATFTFDSLAITTENGNGLVAVNGGTVNINDTGATVAATMGAGLNLENTTGQTNGGSGWTFADVDSTNSAGPGARLVDLGDPVTINDGAIAGAAGSGFLVDGSSANVTYSGTIANSAGFMIEVLNTTAGTVLFDSGAGGTPLNDTGGTGIRIDAVAGNVTIDATATSVVNSTMSGLTVSGATTGTVTVNDTTVTNSAGPAVNVDGGAGDALTGVLDFNNLDVSQATNNARAVSIVGMNAGGSVDFDGSSAITATDGTGIIVNSNAAGSANFNGPVDLGNGGSRITDADAFTMSANGMGMTVGFANLDIFTNNVDGIDAGGMGTLNAAVGALNSMGTGYTAALNLAGIVSGVSVADLDCANNGNCVSLNGIGGTTSFDDVNITNTGGVGFFGTMGGTVEVADADTDNTITATNAVALSLTDTTIGGNGITGGINFLSISASGANNGIVLNNTGTGRFVVTGIGTTDGSGGTLQNINNNGIELITANNISISNMDLLDANLTDGCGTEAYDEFSGGNPGNQGCRGAIYLRGVMHPTFDNITIDDTVDQGINGVGVTHFRLLNSEVLNAGNNNSESGILLRDLFGTVGDGNVNQIVNSTVSDAAQIGVFIRNNLRTNGFAGEPDRLELTGSQFLLSAATDNGDNVTVSLRDDNPVGDGNGANFETVVNNCTFTGRVGASNTTDQIQVDAGINAKSQVSITNSNFTVSNTGINLSGANGSQTLFTVDSNPNIVVRFGTGVNLAVNGTASMTGTVSNNPNIDSDQPNNPAFGIAMIVDSNGSAVIDIDNNTVTDFLLPLRAGARGGTGTADVTIRNNDMTSSAVTGFGVMDLICGNGTVGESNTVCFNIFDNDAFDPLLQGEYFITMTTGTTCTIEGYAGLGTDKAAIEAFVDGNQNSGVTTVCDVGSCGIGIVSYSVGGTCGTPP